MARPSLHGVFSVIVLAWHCLLRVPFTCFWRGTALWEYQPFLSSCLALPWRHAFWWFTPPFLVESYQELDYCSPMTTGLLRAFQPCTMGRCPNQRYHMVSWPRILKLQSFFLKFKYFFLLSIHVANHLAKFKTFITYRDSRYESLSEVQGF